MFNDGTGWTAPVAAVSAVSALPYPVIHRSAGAAGQNDVGLTGCATVALIGLQIAILLNLAWGLVSRW
jgi:hypothetical protein